MSEEFDRMEEIKRLSEHLASGKAGPPPLLVRSGDGTVREVGRPLAGESEDDEEGPDPAAAS